MANLLQVLIVGLTIFLTTDAILWFLFQWKGTDNERELIWSRLREKHSKLFKYASMPIQNVGAVICKIVPRKPIHKRWKIDSTVVPFSMEELAGYHFIASFLVGWLCLFLWNGATSILTPTIGGLFVGLVWSILKVRGAQLDFYNKLLQVQVDLGFAIDMAQLFHNEKEEKSMSVSAAIQLVAKEFSSTELGEEFSIVAADLQDNISLPQSLKMMHKRLNWDDHVGRFVELISAQHEGSASQESLQQLADEINRYRRNLLIDHAEKAKVKLALPTTMVTFACIFILTAPFLVRMGELIKQFS